MSTLTDRYVHATARSVPASQRSELSRELRGEIAEMVAGRTEAGEPAADAERGVLAELGDPEALAATYVDRPLQLIGPAYFLVWKRLTVLLLAWVPAIVALTVAAVGIGEGKALGPLIGDAVVGGVQAAVQVAFWTTLVFAAIDRFGSPADAPAWTPDALPDLPAESHVDLGDTVAWVATGVIAIALLVWQEIRGVIEVAPGVRAPLIDSDLWSSWLPFIVAVLALEVALTLLAHRRGRWTPALLGGAAVTSLGFGVPTIWLLLEERLIDPRFVREIAWLGEADHLRNISVVVAVAIAAITVGDLGKKALSARRAARAA